MLTHILNNILDSDVNSVLNNTFVQIPDDVLDHSELLKELAARVKDFMGEDILLTIYPQIRESFLGRVEDLSQIAQTSFFVEHLVSF